MEQSQNCWIDGSLHDHQWYTQVFAKIRARYPHYRLAIIYIYAAPELVFERAEKRGQKTGRYVPKEILAKSIKNTQIAAEILGPQVDFYAEISNDAEEPLLMKCEDRGHSFRAFSQRFRLFENAIRAFPANMPPVAFMDEKGATELFNVTQAIKDAFQTRVFSSLTNAKDAPPQGCLALPIKEFFTPAILEQIKPLLRGKKGAEHIMALPVTRSPEEVKHLLRWDGAPDTASHMLYCIGAFTKDGKPVQQAAISQCSKFVQSLLSNQTIGFSIYVGDQMQIVGLSRMSISQGSGRSGNRRFVAYSAAREVDPRFREALEAQGRWNVGLFPLMKFHAKHCALVLPNEIKDCPAGALAFVLHNSKCIYFARIPPD